MGDMWNETETAAEAATRLQREVQRLERALDLTELARKELERPISMRLVCPACGALHVDEGDFADKPHHTHACQECGNVWRPAIVPTVGVRFLPGFKNKHQPSKGDPAKESTDV